MKKTLVIAEAGVNHNGDINLAHRLIDAAVEVGADIIKFQTFNSLLMSTAKAEKASYQISDEYADESQQQMLSKLELSHKDHYSLIKHCKDVNIEFLSTAFDEKSIDLLSNLRLKRTKIPSGEITNLPYLRKLCSLKKPVILSTGMANLEEVKLALDIIKSEEINSDEITVLHCSTEYPANIKTVNLKAIETLTNTFNVDVGYSDHTSGIEIAIAAAALGAKIIEKHITLDREMIGPDHKASTEPDLFKQMIDSIRNVDLALGNGIKLPSDKELENRKIVRKSIVASCNIKKGEIFTSNNLIIKRPGTGISPMKWDLILGEKSKYNFQKDDLIIC